jgi:hypothetical protein
MMNPLSISGAAAVVPAKDESWQSEIPAHLLRRDPRIWRMAYAAALRLLKGTDKRPRSVMAATALGALDETKNFLDGIFGDGFGSPRNFIASVHNSMAGKLALEFSIDGPNLTFCDGPNSLASAICACGAVLGDDHFPALVIGVDEHVPMLSDIVPFLSPACREFLGNSHEEGAVALLLDKGGNRNVPGIRAVGPFCRDTKKPGGLSAGDIAALFGPAHTGGRVVLPTECRSFIGAAVSVFEYSNNPHYPQTIVASYSPSSNAYAAIEVTL